MPKRDKTGIAARKVASPVEVSAPVSAAPNGSRAQTHIPHPLLSPEANAFLRPVPEDFSEELTPRELEIAWLISHGKLNKQVADQLHISEYTVSAHLRRIFAKLRVHNRAAMVFRCSKGIRDLA